MLPSDVQRRECSCAISKLSLLIASSYNHRAMKRLESMPPQLLKFAKEPPNKVCELRMAVAQELCTADIRTLELTTIKFLTLRKADVAQCAHTGCCSAVTYQLWRMVSYKWLADTGDVESINKMVTLETKRSPNISFPLLDARTGTRKQLGLLSHFRGVRRPYPKLRDIRPVMDYMIDSAVAAIQSVDHVLGSRGRFAPLEGHELRTNIIEDDVRVLEPLKAPTQVAAVVAPFNTAIHKSLSRPASIQSFMPLVFIGLKDELPEVVRIVWARAKSYYSTGWMVQCVVTRAESGLRAVPSTPFVFKTSIDVLVALASDVGLEEIRRMLQVATCLGDCAGDPWSGSLVDVDWVPVDTHSKVSMPPPLAPLTDSRRRYHVPSQSTQV